MKRILAFVLIIVFAIALAGCDAKEPKLNKKVELTEKQLK